MTDFWCYMSKDFHKFLHATSSDSIILMVCCAEPRLLHFVLLNPVNVTSVEHIVLTYLVFTLRHRYADDATITYIVITHISSLSPRL